MYEKVACQPEHEVGLPDPAFSRQPEYIVVIKIRYDRTLSVEPAVIIPIMFKEGKDGILALRRDEIHDLTDRQENYIPSASSHCQRLVRPSALSEV